MLNENNEHIATVTLTYTQLNQLRNALATRLVKRVLETPFEEQQDDYWEYVTCSMQEAYDLLEKEVGRLVTEIEEEIVLEETQVLGDDNLIEKFFN